MAENYYIVKLEYSIFDWRYGQKMEVDLRHDDYLVQSHSPLDAIEYAKEMTLGDIPVYYVEPSDYVLWRVSTASRVPVPGDKILLSDQVVYGEGWASNRFIAVPENRAMWLDRYLFRPARNEGEIASLLSNIGEGTPYTFAFFGKEAGWFGTKGAVMVSSDGCNLGMNRNYYDFITHQLGAKSWQWHRLIHRDNDGCFVAYGEAGEPVAYVMPFTPNLKWEVDEVEAMPTP